MFIWGDIKSTIKNADVESNLQYYFCFIGKLIVVVKLYSQTLISTKTKKMIFLILKYQTLERRFW